MSTKLQLADEALDHAGRMIKQAQRHTREQSLTTALATIAVVQARVEIAERHIVEEARRFGASWSDVGQALGISRQSAWERFSPRTKK